MDSRRQLVLAVRSGVSLSEACRHGGVTRKTGRKWVRRAGEGDLSALEELSRAPKRVANRTVAALEQVVLDMKETHPKWGAKKLVIKLEEKGINIPLRSADRILARHGLTIPRVKEAEPVRFERAECGALLQMDFKGLPMSTPYALLSVLDDSARFCLNFSPVPDKKGPSVRAVLWELFGEHGLPNEMLMDNGDCWGGHGECKGPTRFDVWLMLLGIRPIHGRPYHPQTQGKVERFHETAKREMGERLVQPTIELARIACAEWVRIYNWDRPHEGIGMRVPGSLYKPFARPRPEVMPIHQIEEGAISRSVMDKGNFCFKGKEYLAGDGLRGQRIVLKEAEFGMRLYFAGFPLKYLSELELRKEKK
jgi:transposase InsO family protein